MHPDKKITFVGVLIVVFEVYQKWLLDSGVQGSEGRK